jgi:hypothetical protein
MPNTVPAADTGSPLVCPVAALAAEAAFLIASVGRVDEAFLEAGGKTKNKLERELDELTDALRSVRDRAAYLQTNSARGALFQVSLARAYLRNDDQIEAIENNAVRLLYSVRRWISQAAAIEPDVESEYFMSANLNPHSSREAALSRNAESDGESQNRELGI